MQETGSIHAQSENTESPRPGVLRRYLPLWLALAVLLLLAIVPPLISVNRFQRRIATSISGSLGRPVHLDRVTLNLLPLPGFTLDNLVVEEDPAFGSEPIIRANSVRVTLRISSLWSKRVEFSTISFTDPSVNLVHLPNGKWNLESILLQASHIEAAPTAQRRAGPAPRFPYIEATGARLNFKLGQEKIPLSFTDANFALWLPNPRQWRLRLKANPVRTDSSISGAGTIQVEGTLGRAASLGKVPIHLQGEWSDAPLGGATRVMFGHDAGWRGDITLSANVQGTVGNSAVETRLTLSDARRADFVPRHPLNIEMECLGTAANLFHSFNDIRCNWPPSGSSGAQMVLVSGSMPDIRKPDSAKIDISVPGIPADTLLDWLHVINQRIPDDISLGGTLTGGLSYHPGPIHPTRWQGEVFATGAKLTSAQAGSQSLIAGDLALRSVPQFVVPTGRHARHSPPPPSYGFVLAPAALDLGGKEPAMLEGHFDEAGYTLHLTGMATSPRLQALADALPEFGDGLAKALPANSVKGPFRIDLTAVRPWGETQVWTQTPVHPVAHHPRRARNR
jgi:AsmA protein